MLRKHVAKVADGIKFFTIVGLVLTGLLALCAIFPHVEETQGRNKKDR